LSLVVLLVYGGLLFLTERLFSTTPTGFIPAQDKGYLLVNVQLSDASPLERTEAVMKKAEEIAGTAAGVKHTLSIAGQSILLGANAPNFGSMYVMLDDFENRKDRTMIADGIAERLRSAFDAEIQQALVNILGAPPVDGLGTSGGFKLMIEDRGGGAGLKALQAAGEKIVAEGGAHPSLRGLFTSFRAETPWLDVDIDRREAKTMGVSIGDLFGTLQVYFGSYYVNDFNRFGRTWQVNVQADEGFRDRIEDLRRLRVRNAEGTMVPLGSIASFRETTGPVMMVRYNLDPAASVQGMPGVGYSSGQAIEQMERLAREHLPSTMRSEWTELALLQLQAGNTATIAFFFAVAFVFLVLAAQYESWSLPLAVILVVPMCLLCAVAAVAMVGRDINIFTQIGLVVLVGLSCKNAILIVEFAKARREAGADRYHATLEACRLRLRPILMTSFAFILGVVPLVVARGAGAEMHRSLGTAVFGGMLGVTLFGIFLTPVFYYVIQWLSDWQTGAQPQALSQPVPEE
jgi:hydrophobe/amphiphile efflux-1 (HAE1) family protein